MANDQPLDQSDLVDRWVQTAAQDRKSFGQLFDLFYPQIFAYCSRRLLVRAVAEDVTSEVFLKVAKAIASFQGSTAEDFRRWLFRITTNEINAWLRKSIRQQTLLESAATMGFVGKQISRQVLQTESEVDWEQIYRAIGELTEREQSIVSLKFFGQQFKFKQNLLDQRLVEESLIESLSIFSKASDGQFLDELSTDATHAYISTVGIDNYLGKGDQPASVYADNATKVALGISYATSLLPTEAKPHYAGKGVSYEENSDQPIFWYWLEEGQTWRVLGADLEFRDADEAPNVDGAVPLMGQ